MVEQSGGWHCIALEGLHVSRIRVDVTLYNETDYGLALTEESLDVGDWTSGWEPPQSIPAHSSGRFHAEGS